MNVQNDCSKQEPSIPGKETLDMQLMILPQEKLQEPVGALAEHMALRLLVGHFLHQPGFILTKIY